MKVSAVNFDIKMLGAIVASASDKEQGDFFNGMAEEFKRFETKSAPQLQISYTEFYIKEDNKDILEDALPMLWYKESKE